MYKVRVQVVSEDIERGVVGSCDECPIALAIKECFAGDFWDNYTIKVDRAQIDVGPFKFKTPPRLKKFIKAFDNGEKVRPFVFWLE